LHLLTAVVSRGGFADADGFETDDVVRAMEESRKDAYYNDTAGESSTAMQSAYDLVADDTETWQGGGLIQGTLLASKKQTSDLLTRSRRNP
jgi:hypothetical protein